MVFDSEMFIDNSIPYHVKLVGVGGGPQYSCRSNSFGLYERKLLDNREHLEVVY